MVAATNLLSVENEPTMKPSVYWIILLAFLLRLGLGLTASMLLPQVGYADSKPQQAGYLFFDAYRRDSQAWDLAQSGKPLSRAFDQKYAAMKTHHFLPLFIL